jgi:hypothetical protein
MTRALYALYAFNAAVYAVSIAYAVKRRADLRKAAAARAAAAEEAQLEIDALDEDSKRQREIIKELEERVVEARHENVMKKLDFLADKIDCLDSDFQNYVRA